MPFKPSENSDFKVPERPLECSECKKSIAVRYTEIAGNTIINTSMCSDCPELERRLHGLKNEGKELKKGLKGTGIACGTCGTTLEAVRMGTSLGCPHCYDVFSDILIAELISADKLPPRLASNKKIAFAHNGRSPGEIAGISPSSRILALNDALNETLKLEDYEQAAWLRDQIKALTEKSKESDETERN